MFRELREARKLLVLPNDRVGGLFIGAPICQAIRRSYPDAELVLLVDETKASIAAQIPFVDRVVSGALHRPVWSSSFAEMGECLRRDQFDLSFSLGPDCSFHLAQLSRVAAARLRVGFRRPGPETYNLEIVPRDPGVYEGEQGACMLRMLGLAEGGEVTWALAPDQAREVRARYLNGGSSSRLAVGIDLAAGEGPGLTSRQLDDVVGRIIELGARAVLFYSLAEKRQVNYLRGVYGNRVLLFQQDDLAGAAALIEGCSAVISCNTDLLHLALALRVPAVGIFDEDPRRWLPGECALVNVVRGSDVRGVSIAQIAAALEQALSEIRTQRAQTE